jgi:uncharacterized protein YfaS (alpha-2-macroglobulin family)
MEQTSSTSYPNVLVKDYLTRAGRARPDVMIKAEQMISIGYQRILTFQTPGGGFGWWAGQDSPVIWVTAYGMHQLADAAKVHEVDPQVLARAQQWLISKQSQEGSWDTVGDTHGERIASIPDARIPLTSYVLWALLETGMRQGETIDRAVSFLRKHVGKAGENPYVLALAALALSTWDPKDDLTVELLKKLEGLKVEEGDGITFKASSQTFSYANGSAADVETTALAAMAMMKAGSHMPTVNKALTFLVKVKTGGGHWGSTQATLLALKALIMGLGGVEPKEPVFIQVEVNGESKGLTVTPDQADVLQLIDYSSQVKEGANQVSFHVEGEASFMYQVVARHYTPWKDDPVPASPIGISVVYDRTELAASEVLKATCRLSYRGKIPTYMVIVDLGLPPGFELDTAVFEKMVEVHRLEKFTVTSRQATLYFGEVKPGDEIEFTYDLRAKYPLKAKAPKAEAYEYYAPQNRAETQPVMIEVK